MVRSSTAYASAKAASNDVTDALNEIMSVGVYQTSMLIYLSIQFRITVSPPTNPAMKLIHHLAPWGPAGGMLLLASLSISANQAATIFVGPNGGAGAEASASAPLASLAEAAERAKPGDVIRIAGGTYKHEQPVRLRASGTAEAPIRVERADAKWPIFNFSAEPFEQRLSGIAVEGNHWHIVGLEVVGAARSGINVTGHSNTIEQCRTHDNQGSGVDLAAPASHNLVLNCDSYRNADRPTRGQNADGFGAKFQIGAGNIFRGCRAWENADDGFDLWKAPHPVRIENCVAFRNGLDLWGIEGFTGNGNGFKLGGDFIPAAHVVIGCVATDQPKNGFDQNNNTAGLTVEHCTAIHCQLGFSFTLATTTGQPHVFRDNMGWDAPAVFVDGTVQERNLWSSSHRAKLSAKTVESTPVTKAAPSAKKGGK
jgi:hypothetical protein